MIAFRCFWRKSDGRNRRASTHGGGGGGGGSAERQSCLRNSEESLAVAAKMQRLKEQGGKEWRTDVLMVLIQWESVLSSLFALVEI